MFAKKLEVGKIYITWNIFDMSNEYFTTTEVEIFEIIGYDKSGVYDIFMYKSYEKIDEENPIIMYNYKTTKERKDVKHCHPAENINNFTIFDFIFKDDIHI